MRIGIIGGGCSGVVCAINAKRDDNEVIVFEGEEKLLKKLLLTGNGRCNYMHDEYSSHDYFSSDIDEISEIITDKNITDVEDFFDDIGVVPKNKNGYIYPVTNQASTVRETLIYKLKEKGVEVLLNSSVKNISKKNDNFLIQTEDRDYYCDRVVIATGGLSYPKTGSRGYGYNVLENFGHTINPLAPALVQLKSDFKYLKEWDGVRTDAILTLYENDEKIDEEEGEVQLTDYGISGICTFNLSPYVSKALNNGKNIVIKINFVPFIDALLTPWLDRYSRKNPNKNIKELLEGILNKKIVSIILKVCHLREDVLYNNLSNDEKLNLSRNLKALPLNIIGTLDYDNAQVTSGGLSLREINTSTMESKIVSGLYATGEILDITGKCGGFNLTLCWISGILAGRSLGDKVDLFKTDKD